MKTWSRLVRIVPLLVVGSASAQMTVTTISPDHIGVASQPTVRFQGAVPSATTQVAFAISGQCATSRFATTPLPTIDTAPLGSGVPAAGQYRVCYSVDGGTNWVEQAIPRMFVVSATPTSIASVTPSMIGAGTTPSVTFSGASPTPTTKVAFAFSGSCGSTRYATTLLDVTETVTLASSISTGGNYVVCYTVNGASWVQQSSPTMTVVTASPSSISAISPAAIGAGTTPTMTFTGAKQTPTSMIAFAPLGQCGSGASRLAETSLSAGTSVPLSSGIGSGGSYRVCYTVDSVTWFEQTSPGLTVASATATSISAISPAAIGAGTTPTMSFTGLVPTPTTMIAFALPGSCSSGRFAETSLTGSDTAPLSGSIGTAGSYRLCYSVNAGSSWVEQSAPQLTVATASPGSISAISPTTIGNGSQPTITFTGATPTPTTMVAFAPAGQCGNAASRLAITALPSSSSAPLASGIASAGLYSLCYSVDGTTYVEQSTPKLTVVTATATTITTITPSTIAKGTQPTVTFTGAVPTPTTKIAFAAVGQCGNAGARLAETLLDSSTSAPLGSSIATNGVYSVCYTVNGLTWFEQATPKLTVVSPAGSFPSSNSGGAPLILRRNAIDPSKLDLTWGASCGAGATDASVHEGALAGWYGHSPNRCTTAGSSSVTIDPSPGGDRYFLVVPLSASFEGSYGKSSAGTEIPPSAAPCRASQDSSSCP